MTEFREGDRVYLDTQFKKGKGTVSVPDNTWNDVDKLRFIPVHLDETSGDYAGGWLPESLTLLDEPMGTPDMVNHPEHYLQYPTEVIEITEKLDFLLGNVVKYVLRSPYKGSELEDLKKARWYLDRKINNLS